MAKYERGQSGNPKGRPKGTFGGRMLALKKLDLMVARKKNQQRVINAMEAELQRDPVGFFKTVIMPLLPKESRVALDQSGILEWRSLLELDAAPGGDPDGGQGAG
jgi:hypothetical protein